MSKNPDAVVDMERRVVRYKDLIPCTNAFVDSRTPGSDKKENFTVIGPGVSENPAQHVHIAEPHGFNIGGARQPPGCLNSQHSHLTAEVFVVHSGKWRFLFGVNADEGSIDLSQGDTISIPPNMFRGFENVGDNAGFLFAILGQDNPGKVTWAPAVFDLAKQYGLKLLKGGRLVDTTVGETVPENAVAEHPPTSAEVAELATPDQASLANCVARANELKANKNSALASLGVREAAVITPLDTADGFTKGPISGWWDHGFNLRRVSLDPGAETACYLRDEAEVLFVHTGKLCIKGDFESVTLESGDTCTVPVGLMRTLQNPENSTAELYVVRGGNSPSAPSLVC